MQDAESSNPLINDTYARRLMGEDGLRYWEDFKRFKRPNAGNTARHYIIDEHIKDILAAYPLMNVFLIGAGLDSRAYRLTGGIWIEIDAPEIISYKAQQLPVEECLNSLTRISIDFSKESLKDILLPYRTDDRVVIIVEGVILYLSNEELENLIQTVKECFPSHIFICDLMKRDFFEVFSRKIHKYLVQSGTTFKDLDNHPQRFFSTNGYTLASITSTVKAARELHLVRMPKLITHHLMGKFAMGYSVYKFEYSQES